MRRKGKKEEKERRTLLVSRTGDIFVIIENKPVPSSHRSRILFMSTRSDSPPSPFLETPLHTLQGKRNRCEATRVVRADLFTSGARGSEFEAGCRRLAGVAPAATS